MRPTRSLIVALKSISNQKAPYLIATRWFGLQPAVFRPLSSSSSPIRKIFSHLQGKRGRPRCHPDCVAADRGYDAEPIRRYLRSRNIIPFLAKRNTEHGSGLGRSRWVAERTFAWLNEFRRLRARYKKRADIHEAFLSLACALICWRCLQQRWHKPSRGIRVCWQ